ncbi:unnamed protein product, partial [Prunus brigantina]
MICGSMPGMSDGKHANTALLFCRKAVSSTFSFVLRPVELSTLSPSLDRIDLVDTSHRDWVTDFLVLGGYDGVDLANPWFTQDAIVRGDFVDDHECLSTDH